MVKPTFVVLAVVGWGFSLPARAQQYVGLPREAVEYVVSDQHNSQWCWAASIQMILNYYKVDIAQEQIVARTYGVDPYGRLPDWGGDFRAITANLNNWNIDNRGKPYVVSAKLGRGAPTPAMLIEELSKRRPVLVGYASGPNSRHAVVITGASFSPGPQGPLIHSLIVRDPEPTRKNIRNRGRVEYPGEFLAQRMENFWYIRVRGR